MAVLDHPTPKEILYFWKIPIIVSGLKNFSLSIKIQLMEIKKLIVTSEALRCQITEVNNFKTVAVMQPEVAFVIKKYIRPPCFV